MSFLKTRCGAWNAGAPARNIYGQRPATTSIPFSSQKAIAVLVFAPGRHTAVHPDALDAGFRAVVDDLVRHLVGGHDQHALHRRPDLLDLCVADLTVQLLDARIDRDRLVSALAKLLPERIGEVLRVVGDAYDGHSLEGEEVVDLLLRRHLIL